MRTLNSYREVDKTMLWCGIYGMMTRQTPQYVITSATVPWQCYDAAYMEWWLGRPRSTWSHRRRYRDTQRHSAVCSNDMAFINTFEGIIEPHLFETSLIVSIMNIFISQTFFLLFKWVINTLCFEIQNITKINHIVAQKYKNAFRSRNEMDTLFQFW